MSSDGPKITVYIPSHNYGRFLTEAIESVLRQTYDSWELLLIDENSSDNTAQVLEYYRSDPRIKIFHTEGIGLHKVCNLALKEARGEYIIRLDGDDIFEENILLVLANYLDTHKETAIVFPDFFLIDEFGEIFSYERRERLYQNNHSFDSPPNGACFLARTEALRSVGGYSEDLRAQDGFYIWLKLLGAHRCDNINLPLYYYRRHQQSLTHTPGRILEARRKIKKNTAITDLDQFRPIIGVIPCRRGYDFAPNLWNRPFRGTPLINRAVQRCIDSSIFDLIVVASDDPSTEDTLTQWNDPRLRFWLRTQRETIRSESVARTLYRINSNFDPLHKGTIALSYIQAPFVTTDLLEEALFSLIINQADTSVGVEEINRPILKRSEHGLRAINIPSGISSDFSALYAESRALLVTRSNNINTGSLMGPKVVSLPVTEEESFVITSEREFQIASILATQNLLWGEKPLVATS